MSPRDLFTMAFRKLSDMLTYWLSLLLAKGQAKRRAQYNHIPEGPPVFFALLRALKSGLRCLLSAQLDAHVRETECISRARYGRAVPYPSIKAEAVHVLAASRRNLLHSHIG
jgi:hypothetical protein